MMTKLSRGFVLTPIAVVIAATLFIAVAAVGGRVYVMESKNDRVAELEKRLNETESKLADQGQEEETTPTPTPTLSPSLSSKSAPVPAAPKKETVVKAATETASAEVPVPQIVVEEYKKVFGRDPGLSDIDYWKGQYRKYGWSRNELNANLVAASKREVERVDVDILAPPKVAVATPTTTKLVEPDPVAPVAGAPSSLAALDDSAYIIAEDGTYLGLVSSNEYDSKSIINEYGSHGSKYASKSIMNDYGSYGGEYASKSPWNKYTSSPPRIFLGNNFVAYLTANSVKSPRIDPFALIGYLKSL